MGQLPERFGWAPEATVEQTAPSQEPPSYRDGTILELHHVSQRPEVATGSWALGPSWPPQAVSSLFLWQP